MGERERFKHTMALEQSGNIYLSDLRMESFSSCGERGRETRDRDGDIDRLRDRQTETERCREKPAETETDRLRQTERQTDREVEVSK